MKVKNMLALIGASSILATGAFAEEQVVFQKIELGGGLELTQTIKTTGADKPKAQSAEELGKSLKQQTIVVAGGNKEMTDAERGQALFPQFKGYDRSAYVEVMKKDLPSREQERVEGIHKRFQNFSIDRGGNGVMNIDQRYQGMKFFNLGATDIDGGRSEFELDQVWSQDQTALLKQTQDRANGIRNRSSKWYDSNKKLVQGLRKALENEIDLSPAGSEEPTFLHTALARTLEIIDDLEVLHIRHQAQQGSMKNRAFYRLLQSQYTFLIEEVAEGLDVGVGTEFQKDQDQFDHDSIEKRFQSYAKAQLKWVNDNLATSKKNSSTNEQIVTAMGGSEIYLKVSEYTLFNVAEDLFYSPWGKKYARSISEMLEHYEALKGYNNGDRSEFYDNVEANRQTYNVINDAIKYIEKAENQSNKSSDEK